MLKNNKLILRILLYATAASTLLNTAVMYFFPCFFPLCSFSAIRLTFIAFAEKRYALVLVAAFVVSIQHRKLQRFILLRKRLLQHRQHITMS